LIKMLLLVWNMIILLFEHLANDGFIGLR